MSQIQIPNLPAAVGLNGNELLEAVQAGTSVRTTVYQISQYVQTYWNLTNVTISGTLTVGGAAAFSASVSKQGTYTLTAPGGFPYAVENSFIYQAIGLVGSPPGTVFPLNYFGVGDLATPSTPSAEVDMLRLEMTTGPGMKGNRVGVITTLVLGAPSGNPSGSNLFAGLFYAWASSPDGGAAGLGNGRGALQGLNGVGRAYNNATHLAFVNGAEIDTVIETGSSAEVKVGLLVVQLIDDAVQGTYSDSAVSISNVIGGTGNGGAGWMNGLEFGTKFGAWSIDPLGTMIIAQPNTLTPGFINNMRAAVGIDFSAVTFSTAFLKSTGFLVDPSGNTTANTLKLPPITAPASPASGFVLYVDSGDGNKLKAKASTGTVTTLASP